MMRKAETDSDEESIVNCRFVVYKLRSSRRLFQKYCRGLSNIAKLHIQSGRDYKTHLVVTFCCFFGGNILSKLYVSLNNIYGLPTPPANLHSHLFFHPSHHHNLLRTLFIETEAGGIIFGKIKQAQFQTKLGCTPHFVPPNSELIFFFSNCIAILKYVSSRESVVQTSIFPRPPYC